MTQVRRTPSHQAKLPARASVAATPAPGPWALRLYRLARAGVTR